MGLMLKFRRQPELVQGIRLTRENCLDVLQEIGEYFSVHGNGGIFVKIPDGTKFLTAMLGDYIIKNLKGELSVCKAADFEATYEQVEK
jgi:hypothetical protein